MCAQIRQRVVSGQRTWLPYLDRVLEGDYQRSGVPTFDFLVFQDFVEKAGQREIDRRGRGERERVPETLSPSLSQPLEFQNALHQ